jgi:hypothetical protein
VLLQISKAEWVAKIAHFKNQLISLETPATFVDQVINFKDQIPSEVFFNLPACGIVRDAYTVGHFALLAGADAVRLELTDWPDGVVRFGKDLINVEATEALEPNRLRGDEYRVKDDTIQADPVEDWHHRADALPKTLEAAIQKKNLKHYSSRSVLVVYIGFGFYGIRQSETEAAIRDCQARLRGRFDAIRVLWSGKLY